MGSGPADEELMLRYGGGDAGAFETLYRRHRGPLYRFLLRQVSDAATAEELFQDVWMRVIDFRGRYEARAKFSSWVFAIAHNRLMDFYRASGRAKFLASEESEEALAALPADDIPADALIDRKRAAERLLAALSELPEAQREALVLQHWHDWSLEEIGQHLGRSSTAVAGLIKRGLKALRVCLQEQE